MDEFVEMDEIGRVKKEIDDLRLELRHLLYLKASGENTDSIDAQIEDLRKKLVELRSKLANAESELGEEYDRHKNNKR